MATHFNLDTQLLSGFSLLVHGGRAAGKTHLLGDALRTEQANGSILFINMAGEDGTLTLQGMGLGAAGVTVSDYSDFQALCVSLRRDHKPYQAIALDSLSELSKWVMRSVVGGNRLPKLTRNSQFSDGRNEWGELHLEMERAVTLIKPLARYFLCACPSDKSMDQLKAKQYITPDLLGRMAVGSTGWFDFVGYLDVTVYSDRIERTFDMTPNNLIAVRQRLPRQISGSIAIPDGPGGWAAIKAAIEQAAT